jgi:hypothetical protein
MDKMKSLDYTEAMPLDKLPGLAVRLIIGLMRSETGEGREVNS